MMMAGGGGASCEWLKGLSQELCYGWVGESGGGLEGGVAGVEGRMTRRPCAAEDVERLA